MRLSPPSNSSIRPRATASGGWIPAFPTSPSAIRTRCRCLGSSRRFANAHSPHDKNWFAYKTSEEEPQAFLAEHVGRELGLAFDPADIALTTGAFAAIMVAFHHVLDPATKRSFPSRRGSAMNRCCLPPLPCRARLPSRRPHSTSILARSTRRSVRGRVSSSSIRRTIRPDASIAVRRWRMWRTSSNGPQPASATASTCSRMNRIVGYGSTAGGSTARPPFIRGRSFPTATARCCSPLGNDSAIWRFRH